jgi:hypothetical protein
MPAERSRGLKPIVALAIGIIGVIILAVAALVVLGVEVPFALILS